MKGKRHLRQAQGNIATSPENSRAGGGDIHTNSLGLFTYIYGTECTGPSGRAARPVFGDRLYRRSTQIKYTLPIKVHFTYGTINGQWHHSTL